MKRRLRITFIIPFTEKTGGIAVVLEYCRLLSRMGHQTRIVYPLMPYWRLFSKLNPPWRRGARWARRFAGNLLRFKRSIEHFSERLEVTPVPVINRLSIPDSDALIATTWPTAYDVAALPQEKGHKFYLVQGYELWCGDEEWVHGSYALPLTIFTISPFLTHLVKTRFQRDVAAEINNGVRLDRFHPPEDKDFSSPRILMMAHELELKGTKDGISALTRIMEQYPQTQVVMFGKCGKPPAAFEFEYHQDPSYEKLLSLYQRANIFISPSHNEGWHLPPMEAMACKCAIVATAVGCIPKLNNGRNMITVPVRDNEKLCEAIATMVGNESTRREYADAGFETISNYTWERCASKLEHCIFKVCDSERRDEPGSCAQG